MVVLKLILESFRFAWNALRMNILRTTLSLLGVTIGIFAIIAVFTLVDSLERNIKNSLRFLDANNLDVGRWPYEFGPNVKWWEYVKRPYVTFAEYEFLQENLNNAKGITIFASMGGQTTKFESSSYKDVTLVGVAHTHKDVYDMSGDVESGRYFTASESNTGKNVAMVGYLIAEKLFPGTNALGKVIKIKGTRFNIIAIFKEEGEGIFGDTGNDEVVVIPYKSFKKIYYYSEEIEALNLLLA